MKRIQCVLLIILCVCILFPGCAKAGNPVQDTQKSEETIGEEVIEASENTNVITWAVPDFVKQGVEENVKKLNRKLLDDGYNFRLEVKILPTGTYRQQVIPLLESGEVDIASAGMDVVGSSGGYAQDFIRGGYFEELSGYLVSEKGQTLWSWYCESEWKRTETDGKYYVIPNQYGTIGSGYLAFNKKYVTEDMLNGVSGTPGELLEVLSAMDMNEDTYGVLGTFSQNSLCIMNGLTLENGVCFDLQTGRAENLFENEKFYKTLQDLNELYQKGYLKIFETMDSERMKQEAVRNGEFVAWIEYGWDVFYEEVKDTVYVLPLKFTMANTLSLTNGINKNSTKKEAALELLTLLYTESAYANLLLYGEKDVDYKLVDGYVCDMSGKAIGANRNSQVFGIYDPALPCRTESVAWNRRIEKDSYYGSEYYVDSAILGFQPDSTGCSSGMKNAMALLQSYSDIWQEKDLEAAWAKANEEFKASGGDELVAELNRQVEEWRNNGQ